MGFFKSDKSIELQSQLDDLVEQNFHLKEECQGYRRTISSFVDVKSKYEESEKQLVKKYEIQIGQLKKDLETEKKSVARKVNQKLLTIGVSTFLPEEISVANNFSEEDIFKQFMKMSESPEKHEFFQKHEKAIDRAMKKSNNR